MPPGGGAVPGPTSSRTARGSPCSWSENCVTAAANGPGCAKSAPPIGPSFPPCPKTAALPAAPNGSAASYRALFPALPTDGQFSRRAEWVRELLRRLRQAILFWADADLEPLRLLDSFPLPLCACYRIRQSSLPISGAAFGYCAAKKQFFWGLRPQLLLTGTGFIDDLFLAPGNCNDTPGLAFYLDECGERGRQLAGQFWVVDNGFSHPALAEQAKERLGLTLLVRQRDRPGELPSFWQQTLDRVRKPIEGVIAVLTECLGIEHLLAKTDLGLFRRTQAKATAFSLARYFNRVLGIEPMDIARYAV
jgi:hypothetical protein